MSEKRRMFPELGSDLETVSDMTLQEALDEAATGPSSFGPHKEWTEWYHYLLPRLIEREWAWSFFHPGEVLITAFMTQHPVSDDVSPYKLFRSDALKTLGSYIMSPRFWPEGEVDAQACLGKWQGPNGIACWFDASGFLSASLFFCIKYLEPRDVAGWFRSVISIPDPYWRAQLIIWLIGAHPILTGEIDQPAEFPEVGPFDIGWNWSHRLTGNYSGSFEEPVQRVPFLPAASNDAVLEIARDMETEAFFEELLTNPKLEAVAAETQGMQEQFAKLYRG